MGRLLIALALVLGLGVGAANARAESFEPARTYAVVAGVLEWQDARLRSFDKTHRKDRELYELLGTRGVPDDQRVLLLDSQATTQGILAAVATMVAAAPPGSTLLFYYAGHGVKTKTGDVVFASYDLAVENLDGSGLHLDALRAALGAFRGRRVVLLADCCYSGGLAEVARALRRDGRGAVALTSAESSNVSTGNWTYTQTLLDGLRGRATADRDGDQTVSLGELAVEVKEAMRYRESQRSGYANAGVGERLIVAVAQPTPPEEKGAARRSWLLASRGTTRRPVRVLGAKGDKLLVSFYDYATETDVWVPAADAGPFKTASYPVGSSVDVRWQGRTYEAKVLEVDDGFHRITYPGYSASWDEWVMADRIVGARGATSTQTGRRVKVEWHGVWWDAVVDSETDGGVCVHYVGYSDAWNECVPASRLRAN